MIALFISMFVFVIIFLIEQTISPEWLKHNNVLVGSLYCVIAILLLFEGFMFVETNRMIFGQSIGGITYNTYTAYGNSTTDTELIMIYHETTYSLIQLIFSMFIPLSLIIGLLFVIYTLTLWNKDKFESA